MLEEILFLFFSVFIFTINRFFVLVKIVWNFKEFECCQEHLEYNNSMKYITKIKSFFKAF